MLSLLFSKPDSLARRIVVFLFPYALRGRDKVNWRKVGKVSGLLSIWPMTALTLATLGFERIADFMANPFNSLDRGWLFIVPFILALFVPLVAAIMYWSASFLRSRCGAPFFKAAIWTLILAPALFFTLVYADVIATVVLAILAIFSGVDVSSPRENSQYSEHYTFTGEFSADARDPLNHFYREQNLL